MSRKFCKKFNKEEVVKIDQWAREDGHNNVNKPFSTEAYKSIHKYIINFVNKFVEDYTPKKDKEALSFEEQYTVMFYTQLRGLYDEENKKIRGSIPIIKTLLKDLSLIRKEEAVLKRIKILVNFVKTFKNDERLREIDVKEGESFEKPVAIAIAKRHTILGILALEQIRRSR